MSCGLAGPRGCLLADIPRVILEGGIFVSHIVWRIRYRKVLREAKRTGKTVDEILDPGGGCSDAEKGADPKPPGEDPARGPSERIDTNAEEGELASPTDR